MTATRKAKGSLVAVLLGLAAAMILVERCATYDEPLERDITTYAVIGSELLKGRALYSDLWDHKPPAIHITFALAEAVAGEGPVAVLLLNLLAALATLLGLYKAGKALGGTAAGLWAALIWAVVCGDLTLQANQPNVEVFLNAFQAWVFALWLEPTKKGPETRRWVLIGMLSAIASLYKPFAVVEVLMLSAASLALNLKVAAARKKILRQAALILACVLAAWMATGGWFALQGRWSDFKDAVFTYNLYYGEHPGTSFFGHLRNIGGQALGPGALSGLLLLFGLLYLWRLSLRKKNGGQGPFRLWLAFTLTALYEITVPGHYFPHYFQLLTPPLVLGGAWGITQWAERAAKKKRRWRWVPGALLMALLVFHEAPFYALSPEEWANQKYTDGPLFLKSYELGRVLDEGLKPGESFYEWGNESGLYFASHRSPPSGVFYSYPLMDNPLAVQLSQRVVADLEREKPEVIVLNMTYYASPEQFHRHPVLQWVLENYRPLPQGPYREPFLLVMRKGGNLEKRMTVKTP